MPGPQTPAIASTPVPPPIAQAAMVDNKGFLTPVGLDFLQRLWAGVFGAGGAQDITFLGLFPPGVTGAQAESLRESTSDQKSPLSSSIGRFGAIEQAIAELRRSSLRPSPWQIDSPSMIAWTPTIAGSTTLGTQTYALQWGGFARVGPAILALFSVTLSALDGATAGNTLIKGLPFAASNAVTPQGCGWLSQWGGVTLTAGYTALGVTLDQGTSAFHIVQGGSASNAILLGADGLGAASSFIGGAVYFP